MKHVNAGIRSIPCLNFKNWTKHVNDGIQATPSLNFKSWTKHVNVGIRIIIDERIQLGPESKLKDDKREKSNDKDILIASNEVCTFQLPCTARQGHVTLSRQHLFVEQLP
jgi:hypothetical protein